MDWDLYCQESNKSQITDHYEIGQQIGLGAFSRVYSGRCCSTLDQVAVKVIQKRKVDPRDIQREISIWKLAGRASDRVVKLYNVYEDADHMYFVMELMSGGELFEKIVTMDNYSEKTAADIIHLVLQIICDLHKEDIVHQDIKPENLVLDQSHTWNSMKLCDFGLAQIAGDDVEIVGVAGSTLYMAPEVVKETGHGKPVDIYAAGVILYILLCGYPPLQQDIKGAPMEFPSPGWDQISPTAKDLIQKLLVVDPDQRPTAEECLKHPWFSNVESQPDLSIPLLHAMKSLTSWKEARKQHQSDLEAIISEFQRDLCLQREKMNLLKLEVQTLLMKYANLAETIKK